MSVTYPSRGDSARFWCRFAWGVAVLPVTVPVELARHLLEQRRAES